MKVGRHFRIPEGPLDVDALWRGGAPLDACTVPTWLPADLARSYRVANVAVRDESPPPDDHDVPAEIAELEWAGLVVESSAESRSGYRVFVGEPAPVDEWSIGIFTGDSPLRLAPARGARNPVLTRDHVTDVAATFVADPFMIRVDGTWFMYFEVFNWRSGKGEIALATSADALEWAYQRVVLAEPFHLSYPHVFAAGDEVFMVPESFQAGGVRLYRADPFPFRWSFVETLLTSPYIVDPSPFFHGGRWWLFAETSATRTHDTLRLYGAADLAGPWKEHPSSPLRERDARASRPAGRVVKADGRLLRYAQDCAPEYGSAVRAFEIAHLSEDAYVERAASASPVLRAASDGWNGLGMHHADAHELSSGRWVACVDGRALREGRS